MTRLADRLQRWTEYLMALLLGLIMVLLFANVVGRYVFHSGIAVADEVSRLAFVWLIFLGAIIAVRERSHIGIDMVVRAMPVWGRRLSLVFCNALILFALALFAQGSWTQTLVGLRTVSPLTGLPVAVFAAAGLASAIGMGLIYLIDTLRALLGRLDADELVQVQETVDVADVHPDAKP
ncbi:TRAP transporter small permease [Methylobrevis albus]|uniref:TRAP transporter small permease protein n=1 Tax=Methylobrevis albus TaxID=2793297 RepID=A0A931I3U1_9HYPH|nr:TRAP transporter small permease [Methylobrevis albus]MBH0238939.1 TRAP transporter small permease [Methylobrevis albus]